MPNNPNAVKNLKPFKKGEVHNPNGRPKKYVSQTLDELREKGYTNVSRQNIVNIYETMLALSEDELKVILADTSRPMIYRIVVKNMLSNKGFDIIEKMLDRTHGKPTNKTEVEISETDARKEERYAKFLHEPDNHLPNDSTASST